LVFVVTTTAPMREQANHAMRNSAQLPRCTRKKSPLRIPRAANPAAKRSTAALNSA
jgi:hypothetical protein